MKYLTVKYEYASAYGNSFYEGAQSISLGLLAKMFQVPEEELEVDPSKLLNVFAAKEVWLGELEGKHSEGEADLEVEITDEYTFEDSHDLDRLDETIVELLYDNLPLEYAPILEELGYTSLYDYWDEERERMNSHSLSISETIKFANSEDMAAFEKELELLKGKYKK